MIKLDQVTVFDCNQRLGAMPYGKMSVIPPGLDLFGDEALDRRRKNMAQRDIDVTLINPVWYYERPNGAADTRACNDRVAQTVQKGSDILAAGVGLAEPMHGAAGIEEIARVDDELGFVGIFYANSWQGLTVNDQRMAEHFEVLQQRRMLAFLHMPSDSMAITPPMLSEIAADFPDLPMVVLDWGHSMQHSAQLVLDARRFPNVHYDTSGVIPGMMAEFVRQNGSDQLVFGSDMYSHTGGSKNTPSLIREILPEQDAAKVLRDNLVRLLRWTGRPVVEDQ